MNCRLLVSCSCRAEVHARLSSGKPTLCWATAGSALCFVFVVRCVCVVLWLCFDLVLPRCVFWLWVCVVV